MSYDYADDPYEIGEFSEDGAMDQLCHLIRHLTERIDKEISSPGFSSIELSSVRANIRMLAMLVSSFGGSGLVDGDQVAYWSARIDSVFTDPSKWGFTEWPAEVKNEWMAGCVATVKALVEVIDKK